MIYCNKCNCVISNISNNPEWRYYGSSDTKATDPTRCGLPINVLLPKSSVGSIVSNQFSKDKSMYQVKKYTSWNSMTYKERSIYKIFSEITEICKKNDIQQIIVNESKSLYKLISEQRISRGNNRKGIIAACLYFACKNCNVARSSKEIADMFNININSIFVGTDILRRSIKYSVLSRS